MFSPYWEDTIGYWNWEPRIYSKRSCYKSGAEIPLSALNSAAVVFLNDKGMNRFHNRILEESGILPWLSNDKPSRSILNVSWGNRRGSANPTIIKTVSGIGYKVGGLIVFFRNPEIRRSLVIFLTVTLGSHCIGFFYNTTYGVIVLFLSIL